MLNIAIYEGADNAMNKAKDIVIRYFNQNHLTGKIKVYNDPHLLVVDAEQYDAFILDTRLLKYHSLEDIRVRRMKLVPNSVIIFCESMAGRIPKGSELKGSECVIKTNNPARIGIILDCVRERLRRDFTIVRLPQAEEKLKIADIGYIDIESRCLCYHLADKKMIYSATLQTSFQKALPVLILNPTFVYIKPSLLINLGHIQKLYKDHMELYSGEILYFPSTAYNLIHDKWTFGADI